MMRFLVTPLLCFPLFATELATAKSVTVKTSFLRITNDEFNEGWEKGWAQGWKHVRGEFFLPPLAPLPPLPPIGRDTFEGGFALGMLAALDAASGE